jgi:hypothetical protein
MTRAALRMCNILFFFKKTKKKRLSTCTRDAHPRSLARDHAGNKRFQLMITASLFLFFFCSFLLVARELNRGRQGPVGGRGPPTDNEIRKSMSLRLQLRSETHRINLFKKSVLGTVLVWNDERFHVSILPSGRSSKVRGVSDDFAHAIDQGTICA